MTTQTTANNIRSSVNNMRNNTASQTQPLSNYQMLTSALAVYRQSQNPSYTATDQHQHNYASIVDMIKAKRGITSSNQTSNIEPLDVVKSISRQIHLEEHNKDNSSAAIRESISEIYTENSSEPETIARLPEEIYESNLYDDDKITFEDYQTFQELGIKMHLSPETLEIFEKQRIATINHQQARANAGEVSSTQEGDPNLAHHDDDNKIKISDGDIIDYLMKECILPSWAWCIDKTAGIGGVILYEAGHEIYDRSKPRFRNAAANWQQFKDKVAETLAGSSTSPQETANFEDFLAHHEAVIEQNQTALNTLREDTSFTALATSFCAGMSNHYHSAEDFGLYINGEFFSYKDDQEKEQYLHLQSLINDKQIDLMIEKLNIPASTPEEKEKIRKDITDYHTKSHKTWQQQQEQNFQNNTSIPATLPETPYQYADKGYNFAEAFTSAGQDIAQSSALAPMIAEQDAEANIFASQYAMFSVLQAKLNGQNFSKQKDFEDFVNQSTLEGREMFFVAQQRRTQGHFDKSNAELLQILKEQTSAALTAINTDSRLPLTDNVRNTVYFDRQTNTDISDQKQTLLEAFNNQTTFEFLVGRIEDLSKEEQYLNSQQNLNDEKRNRLQQIRANISAANRLDKVLNGDKKVSNTNTTHQIRPNINIPQGRI